MIEIEGYSKRESRGIFRHFVRKEGDGPPNIWVCTLCGGVDGDVDDQTCPDCGYSLYEEDDILMGEEEEEATDNLYFNDEAEYEDDDDVFVEELEEEDKALLEGVEVPDDELEEEI